MILELEIIEQIEDETLGRSVSWLCDFMKSHGRSDSFVVLRGMWRDGYLRLADEGGEPLPRWKCEELFRNRLPTLHTRVLATDRGLDWVHGPPS